MSRRCCLIAALAASACSKQAAEEVESETRRPGQDGGGDARRHSRRRARDGRRRPRRRRRARRRRARSGADRRDPARPTAIACGGATCSSASKSRTRRPKCSARPPKSTARRPRSTTRRQAQTRARELFDRGVAARKEVEDADRGVADAEAALTAGARVARRRADRAPRADRPRHLRRRSSPSVRTTPATSSKPTASDPVLRVIDPRRLEVVASVPLTRRAADCDRRPAPRWTVERAAREARLEGHLAPGRGRRRHRDDPGASGIRRSAEPSRPARRCEVDIDAEQHNGRRAGPGCRDRARGRRDRRLRRERRQSASDGRCRSA